VETSRLIGIALRAGHTAAMALLVGGAFLAPHADLHLWQALTAGTGVALLVSETSHSRHWIYQGRGLTTIAHVGVLGLVLVASELRTPAHLAAVALGSIGSHLPRSLRKWSFRHGRIMD
jgi:hypothetical protein